MRFREWVQFYVLRCFLGGKSVRFFIRSAKGRVLETGFYGKYN